MKAKKETKPSNGQQQSEPETEENEDTGGETQLSETSSTPEGATKIPLIPSQYHIDNVHHAQQQPQQPQQPLQPQPIFYSENGGQNQMHVIS